jgi:RHS repeat-associated protein
LRTQCREYELTNHLGNVLATVSDAKLPAARVLSHTDYYAFGSAMPGRSGTPGGGSYRYGFNGKENDSETGWQDYGMRMYNPRLSRFFSPDPLIVQGQQYPELSSYQFAGNNPIKFIDLDGLEPAVPNQPAGINRVPIPATQTTNPMILPPPTRPRNIITTILPTNQAQNFQVNMQYPNVGGPNTMYQLTNIAPSPSRQVFRADDGSLANLSGVRVGTRGGHELDMATLNDTDFNTIMGRAPTQVRALKNSTKLFARLDLFAISQTQLTFTELFPEMSQIQINAGNLNYQGTGATGANPFVLQNRAALANAAAIASNPAGRNTVITITGASSLAASQVSSSGLTGAQIASGRANDAAARLIRMGVNPAQIVIAPNQYGAGTTASFNITQIIPTGNWQ